MTIFLKLIYKEEKCEQEWKKLEIKRNGDKKIQLGVNKTKISVALIFLSKGSQSSLLALKVVNNKENRR